VSTLRGAVSMLRGAIYSSLNYILASILTNTCKLMIYSFNSERRHDIAEYQLKPQKAKIEIPRSFSLLSEIDMAYAFTFKKVSGIMLSPEILKQTGTFYIYQPDERPYTFRAIGKSSPGPSPPLLFNPIVY